MVLLSFAGCHCGPGIGGGAGAAGSSALAGPMPDGAKVASRYLLVGNRLPELRRRAASGWPAWERLLGYCEAVRDSEPPEDGAGAENLAVCFVVGGDRAHGRAALARARRTMARDLSWDSYLAFGDMLRRVALVRDLAADALSEVELRELVEYLDSACHELWFANRGSGWGLDDPGNNYHMAFLEGTAHAALVLRKVGHPHAERYLEVLRDRFERPSGVLQYLATRGTGGDWSEGTNYGQRAKQRLSSALAALASMGGPEPARVVPFFRDSVRFAIHQLAPDRRTLFPAGDLARDSAMRVSPYDRDYLQTTAFLVGNAETRGRAAWFLDVATPSYEEGDFRFAEGLYKDVLFPLEEAPMLPDDLPRLHHATGTGMVFARSDWSARATALGFSGARILDQSHAHIDVGSFTLWKGGWQAVDASTFSRSGGLWEAGAHNMVHVVGHERRPATVRGLVSLVAHDGVLFARIDTGGLQAVRRERRDVPLLTAAVRDLVWLEPDTLVVRDEVEAVAPYQWRLHVPERPRVLSPERVEASHADGGISIAVVEGGSLRVTQDDDLEGGGSRAFRIEVAKASAEGRGRFLVVIKVGLGGPPPLAVARLPRAIGLDAIEVDGTAVALIPPGASLEGGIHAYEWRDAPKRHVLVGAEGQYSVALDAARGRAVVSRGAAEGDGLVVVGR